MTNYKKFLPNANTLPYYLLTLAFALMGIALFLGLEKETNSYVVVGLLVVSMTLFATVMLTILKLPKSLQPAPALLDSQAVAPKAEVLEGAKSPMAGNDSEMPDGVIPEQSIAAIAARKKKIVEIKAITGQPTTQSPDNDDGSRLKNLMNTPLGEILVSGLLRNPEQLAQIIVQALVQANPAPKPIEPEQST